MTFLGTGTSQGVPVIGCHCEVCKSTDPRDKRLRSSVLIQVDNINFVIDTGPDFRQQMLDHGVEQLDAILYTHDHRDHIAGLDDIRPFNFAQGAAIDIYAERQVQESLQRDFSYIFSENKYPGIPEVKFHTIHTEPFRLGSTRVVPVRLMHYKLPVLGFRVKDFTYLTDTNFIPLDEREKLVGTKYLVIDALRKQKHISHFSLQEALKISEELAPRRTYFIHMSHRMGLHDKVQKELPKGVELAFDGLVLDM